MSKRRAFEPLLAVLGLKKKEMKIFQKKSIFWCDFQLIFRPPYSLKKSLHTYFFKTLYMSKSRAFQPLRASLNLKLKDI